MEIGRKNAFDKVTFIGFDNLKISKAESNDLSTNMYPILFATLIPILALITLIIGIFILKKSKRESKKKFSLIEVFEIKDIYKF